jgi:hypothetical protein
MSRGQDLAEIFDRVDQDFGSSTPDQDVGDDLVEAGVPFGITLDGFVVFVCRRGA